MSEKMKNHEFDRFLDGALTRVTQAPKTDDAATARVLMRLAPAIAAAEILAPADSGRTARLAIRARPGRASPRSPAARLSAFMSASPGSTGPSTGWKPSQARVTIGAIVFEPEPLIGARP